jgi:hypothetical protein
MHAFVAFYNITMQKLANFLCLTLQCIFVPSLFLTFVHRLSAQQAISQRWKSIALDDKIEINQIRLIDEVTR